MVGAHLDMCSFHVGAQCEYTLHHGITLTFGGGVIALLFGEVLREESYGCPLVRLLRFFLLKEDDANGVLTGLAIHHIRTTAHGKGQNRWTFQGCFLLVKRFLLLLGGDDLVRSIPWYATVLLQHFLQRSSNVSVPTNKPPLDVGRTEETLHLRVRLQKQDLTNRLGGL